jgi:membrane-anchored glycerophosphoryl diester phosphodiesterase (GDPDase)
MIFAGPELVFDQNISAGQAMRNSIRATAGWEVFFLLEFGVLCLLGGTLYFIGADLLEASWKHGQLTLTGYELMLAAFTVLLASLALTLLSISQSLVYLSLKRDATPSFAKIEEREM